jgi:Fic family protein
MKGLGDDRSASTREVARQPAIKAAIFSDSIDLRSPYVSDILTIMTDSNTDNEAAIETGDGTPLDRGEPVSLMEPMRISESSRHRGELNDLAVELAAHSAGFRRSLPEGVLTALADLVRAMNCYYSNLIEGHDTHPVDIERALKNDYSANAEKRNLQLEAKAHIAVQKWIDEGGLSGRTVSADGICEIHGRFCERLPNELLWVENPDNGERMVVVPGALRDRDVKVGQHIAASPGALPRLFQQFERTYGSLGKAETIIAAAAAHHRLLWIHPFLDGNGRVARLMSHSMLLEVLGTGGIWSIARGLARNVRSYKSHLAQCDVPRRNDLDGRGNLSEEGLASFTRFFLETCLDQVKFMEELVQPDRLRDRILLWVEEEIRADALPQKAGRILEAILYRGELPRGDVPELLGASDRHSRRVVAALIERGVVVSESTRAPLRLAFPAKLASRWMPGLFPEQH